MSDRPAAPDNQAGNNEDPTPAVEKPPSSFLSALQQFLNARVELLGLEAKEASLLLSRRLIFLVAAAGAALLTYLLLLIAAGWILNHLLATRLSHDLAAWSVPSTILLLATVHLLTALILGAKARTRSGPPLFEFTRSELQKDRAWLQKKTSENENGN